MKLKSMLLAVRDLQASVAFYKEVFGLRVVADFGANVTLTGGLSLQTSGYVGSVHRQKASRFRRQRRGSVLRGG